MVPEGFPEWVEIMNGWGNKMISAVEVGSYFRITDWILSFLLNCFFLFFCLDIRYTDLMWSFLT